MNKYLKATAYGIIMLLIMQTSNVYAYYNCSYASASGYGHGSDPKSASKACEIAEARCKKVTPEWQTCKLYSEVESL